ncbi:MAG: hypothetical protein OSA78_00865 [Flavobacteriales bacterium]|nr:hypothetical protein [Flavobacteriales bacterium]
MGLRSVRMLISSGLNTPLRRQVQSLLWISSVCVHSLFAVDFSSNESSDTVAWHPLEGALSAPMVLTHVLPFDDDTLSNSFIDWSAYATLQYAPGARLQGSWVQLPTAGGLGWVTGLNVFGQHRKWTWQANLDHWRVAGVRESDWNEAWQWGVWDGLGRAWNPNEADIALLRTTGHVEFRVSRSVVLSCGQEPHHWGQGWRSLWLDRQAAPLPFLSLGVHFDRLDYTHLIARTQHLGVGSPPAFPANGRNNPGSYTTRRGAWLAAHAVEVDLGRGWTGSLFGAVTWLNNDSSYAHRFEAAYALPFISFRPSEYAIGSADNALMGASISWSPRWADERLLLYSQLLLDELVVSEIRSGNKWWGNKWGALGSIQWMSLNRRWRVVAEAIAVRPFTYSHASSVQSWTHQHRPLAHPGGSNFVEGRLHMQWKRNDWKVRLGCVWMQQGVDEPAPLGVTPNSTVGADPLNSYLSRPADYGVDLIWDGGGLIDQAGIQENMRLWGDIAFSLPPLEGQEVFIRGFLRNETMAQSEPNWWRIELGIRLENILEERNW